MKTHENIAEATLSVFEAGDLFFFRNLNKAPQIFMFDSKKLLTISTDILCKIFTSAHKKFDRRRMDEMYGK